MSLLLGVCPLCSDPVSNQVSTCPKCEKAALVPDQLILDKPFAEESAQFEGGKVQSVGEALGGNVKRLPIRSSDAGSRIVEPWDCPACEFKGIREQQCGICGTLQSQSRPIPPSVQMLPKPANVKSPKRSSGVSEWMCVCGRKNNGFVTLCMICSQPKLAVKPPEEAKVEPVEEPWDCPSCTFMGIRGLKCQICGDPRPQPRSRPQPAAADIPASDLKVKCTACGAKGQKGYLPN